MQLNEVATREDYIANCLFRLASATQGQPHAWDLWRRVADLFGMAGSPHGVEWAHKQLIQIVDEAEEARRERDAR